MDEQTTLANPKEFLTFHLHWAGRCDICWNAHSSATQRFNLVESIALRWTHHIFAVAIVVIVISIRYCCSRSCCGGRNSPARANANTGHCSWISDFITVCLQFHGICQFCCTIWIVQFHGVHFLGDILYSIAQLNRLCYCVFGMVDRIQLAIQTKENWEVITFRCQLRNLSLLNTVYAESMRICFVVRFSSIKSGSFIPKLILLARPENIHRTWNYSSENSGKYLHFW